LYPRNKDANTISVGARPPSGCLQGGHHSSSLPRGGATAIPLIEKDFDEAMRVIQENYVDAKSLTTTQYLSRRLLACCDRSIHIQTITIVKNTTSSRLTNVRILWNWRVYSELHNR